MNVPRHAIFEKTSERDICNICLQRQPLTLDHVPPKSTLPVRQVLVKPFFQQKDRRPVGSQSGVKYRTLCRTCNGDRLGRIYDPALIAMCSQARRLHRNRHSITQQPFIEVDASKVIRSVLGHLLAAEVQTPRSRAADDMRAFIMDPSLSTLNGLRVMYWAHPDRSIRVMRETVIVQFGQPQLDMVRCDMLVWYPLGFLVCDRPVFDMPCLDDYLVGNGGRVMVPLRALASGALERWMNQVGRVTGGPSDSAYQADHPHKPEIEW